MARSAAGCQPRSERTCRAGRRVCVAPAIQGSDHRVPPRAAARRRARRCALQAGQRVRGDGRLPKAYTEFTTAADLDASLLDAQVQAGQLLLIAGDFERAKSRAEAAIATDARRRAGADPDRQRAAGLNDTTQALKQMEEAVALDPASAPAYAALGSCSSPRASRRRARPSRKRSRSSRIVDARLALANYDWAAGDRVRPRPI